MKIGINWRRRGRDGLRLRDSYAWLRKYSRVDRP